MIKISAPEGPFSLMISHKGYEIVFFALPDGEEMQCDLKVFKDEEDVSKKFDESGQLTPDSETLYNILHNIENSD
jgi:hypothetical protein